MTTTITFAREEMQAFARILSGDLFREDEPERRGVQKILAANAQDDSADDEWHEYLDDSALLENDTDERIVSSVGFVTPQGRNAARETWVGRGGVETDNGERARRGVDLIEYYTANEQDAVFEVDDFRAAAVDVISDVATRARRVRPRPRVCTRYGVAAFRR